MAVNYLIDIILAMIMFSIGTSLEWKDYQYLLNHPNTVALGLFFQMLFLPLLALIVIIFSDLNPVLKVGLFIVSLCPGGTTSGFVSYLTKADVPLSIALTSINSFLILLTIPLLTNLAVEGFMGETSHIHLPAFKTAMDIVLVILIPVLLGSVFNHFYHGVANMLQSWLKFVNVGLLAIMFSIKFFAPVHEGGSGINWADIKIIFPYAFGIHVVAMLSSYFLSGLFIKKHESCITIGIEVGLQNTTLALMITSVIMQNNEMSKPALVYALFSFFTTLAFAFFARYFKNY